MNPFISKKKFFDIVWNMVGGGLVAGQSAVLLFFVARYYNQEMAGIISISYAIAMFAYTVAKYGIRNYQVTDLEEKYSFKQYVYCRIITTVIVIVGVLVYLLFEFCFNDMPLVKIVVIFEVVLIKMVNAVEDVFLGRLQQQGYFVVGARIMALRELIILILMIILIISKLDIVIVLTISLIISGVFSSYYIYNNKKYLCINSKIGVNQTGNLLKECGNLCISASLAIYISNISKYVVEWYMDEYSQALLGYLILPAFTITLLNQFIYQPFVKELGMLWNGGKVEKFQKTIVRQSVIVLFLALIIVFFSGIFGIPLLSRIFLIDLELYKKEFFMLLLGGSLFAVEFYLSIPITTMRKQREMTYGYVLAIIVLFIIQKTMVVEYGLMGASMLFVIANAFLSVWFVWVINKAIRERQVLYT